MNAESSVQTAFSLYAVTGSGDIIICWTDLTTCCSLLWSVTEQFPHHIAAQDAHNHSAVKVYQNCCGHVNFLQYLQEEEVFVFQDRSSVMWILKNFELETFKNCTVDMDKAMCASLVLVVLRSKLLSALYFLSVGCIIVA